MMTMGKEAWADDYVIKNIRIFYPILGKSSFEFNSHTDKLEQKKIHQGKAMTKIVNTVIIVTRYHKIKLTQGVLRCIRTVPL